ncbi:Olfactory receptor 5A1, partial [Mesitornis unicolor]
FPPSADQHKAFSTCLPYLTMDSLCVSTAVLPHLKPLSPYVDPLVEVLYSVMFPAVNALIYSMRNQELRDALWKLAQWTLF